MVLENEAESDGCLCPNEGRNSLSDGSFVEKEPPKWAVPIDTIMGACRIAQPSQQVHLPYRRRVSSVVEHSSANPKVPGSILGPVSYRGHGL